MFVGFGAGVLGCECQSTESVVIKGVRDPIGVAHRGQGIGRRPCVGRVVGIALGRSVVVGDGKQEGVGRIVGEEGLASIGIGHLVDQAGGVVADLERLAVGMGQAREQPAGVAGRDPVAVGVLNVVDLSVGEEVGQEPADLLDAEGAVAVGDQRPVVARLSRNSGCCCGCRAGTGDRDHPGP